MEKLKNVEVVEIAKKYGLSYAILKMFWEVESSGYGFGSDGRLLIQFEPVWFKRLFHDWKNSPPGSLWIVNKVEVQTKEWAAFNSAAGIDKETAMEATSIGGPQIMGFHWKRLGFKSVKAMWDFFAASEKNQLECLVRFITTDKKLLAAVKLVMSKKKNLLTSKNFETIEGLYNGWGAADFAIANGTVRYSIKLYKSFLRHSA